MPAQTTDPQTEYLSLIIKVFIPGLCSLLMPVVEWFLSHRGTSNRTKQINALLNRIELVEKLNSIQQSSSDPLRIKNVVQFCRDDILQRFESLIRRPLVPAKGLPSWRRFLLMYKQPSFMGKVYRVFFYIFSFVGLVGGPVCLLIHCLEETVKDKWVSVVVGMAFYLVLAFLFRGLAVQSYKKVVEKLVVQKKVAANTATG